jgi:hypothetical protein
MFALFVQLLTKVSVSDEPGAVPGLVPDPQEDAAVAQFDATFVFAPLAPTQ